MAILLADSGSTKTHWALISEGKVILEFKGPGINPTVQKEEEVLASLQRSLEGLDSGLQLERIHFYGAGCADPRDVGVIRQTFDQTRFKGIALEVDHDLMAASRALFGSGSGIAAILGTGSSSCRYIEGQISDRLTSLGYVLGDDGSGVDLGKGLIRSLVNRKLGEDLRKEFFQRYGLSEADIVATLYKESGPNRFLASFAPFLSEHRDDEVCRNIIEDAFDSFLDNCISPYELDGLSVAFCGSVAFHFRDILESRCQQKGFSVAKILQSPMSGLIEYHLQR